MRVIGYKDIDREEWSALVKGSATGTWFQTLEAYSFYESLPDLFRPFVVAVKSEELKVKSQQLRGVCVGYVTVEKSPLKQFLTRRAIIIGGPALADDCINEEVLLLLSTLREQLSTGANAPIYIECRNFNDYSRWKDAFASAGFDYMPHLNFHVDCRDKEVMWERLSENRKRQIKKGQPNPSPSLKGRDVSEADIREWYEILAELYRTKVKTPLFPVEFFLEAYRQGVGKFLLVKHEGKVIGGSMVVMWKPTSDSSLKGREEQPTSDSSLKGREGTTQVSFAKVWGAHTADSTQYNLLKENAIANRKTPTEAETILWDMLKGNNIGLHFRRQHIILDYIVDFICLDKRLVIELDGGYHNNPEQKEYDEQRTAQLQRLGYTELRFTNEELLVNPDSVVAKIKEVASKLPSLKGRTEERLGTVYEWFECGLNAEYKEQYPSVMATWAGMQYANEHGCARYDMMGAGEPGVPYGVRDFKSEFGGELVEQGRFLCVCKPWLYKIGEIGVKLLRKM